MAAVLPTPSVTPRESTSWDMDPAHSSVEFSVRHLMITTIKGLFSKYDAHIVWDDQDLTQSSVVAHIDTNSISTGDAYRDQHLLSPDFMHSEKHTQMTFKSTRIERVSDEEYKIYGDLTCLGVTKEIRLDTIYGGRSVHPITGHTVAGFEARTTINRKDFGMNFNQVLDTGGLALSDTVKVEINAELVRQDGAQPGV